MLYEYISIYINMLYVLILLKETEHTNNKIDIFAPVLKIKCNLAAYHRKLTICKNMSPKELFKRTRTRVRVCYSFDCSLYLSFNNKSLLLFLSVYPS